MGVHREFNFEDDIELLNLKYQMGNGNLSEYFGIETGANEPILGEMKEEVEKTKHQL